MENIIIKNEEELTIENGKRVLIFDFAEKDNQQSSLKIKIGQDCLVDYVVIFNHSRKTDIEVGDNSKLNMNCLYLKGVKSEVSIMLNNDCTVNNQVLMSLRGEEMAEVKDSYVFIGQGSYGRFFVKSLIDGKSSASYFSDLKIGRGAVFSDARIDMNMALLDREAKGIMLPGLKVKNSKVKAGHGASTFHLSPEDLFYLNSRGVGISEAKSLILSSAARQFAGNMKDEKTKNLILELLAV